MGSRLNKLLNRESLSLAGFLLLIVALPVLERAIIRNAGQSSGGQFLFEGAVRLAQLFLTVWLCVSAVIFWSRERRLAVQSLVLLFILGLAATFLGPS